MVEEWLDTVYGDVVEGKCGARADTMYDFLLTPGGEFGRAESIRSLWGMGFGHRACSLR